MPDLFIGLMSGTSFDGIDTALVSFENKKINLLDTDLHPIPELIKQELLHLSQDKLHDLNQICRLDVELGLIFADAVNQLLKKNKLQASDIKAIGSHGQTLRHFPHQPYPYTLQIGDPHVIAVNTGITVVADFRRHDIALGGQGAPLAPLFHHAFMHSSHENRAIVNIGGFANVTILPKERPLKGFDTGPGNVLIDAWAMQHLNKPFDENGQFARQGHINQDLLELLLSDPFFNKTPPKSTGRDDFNLAWLNKHLEKFNLSSQDIQATLLELTAQSIIHDIKKYASQTNAIYICGGGAMNKYLMERLQILANAMTVNSTHELNIDPNWLEAMLMAYLAQERLLNHKLDLGDITGSHSPHFVGTIYPV
ncbi:MAG: anhydro-N-acetylmuramic acid kinase [Taibaiella sp.]|jgi:anhydro-N-acetylmuramic acid kinase